MTKAEAIDMCMEVRDYLTSGNPIWDKDKVAEALGMAIKALKDQDRPIICPRCGRTFSEAEGRENEEIQGLEYAENILENILREQEGSEDE